MAFSEKVEKYLALIPSVLKKLQDNAIDKEQKTELYRLYLEMLKVCAREDFSSYLDYLELDEPTGDPNKKFWHNRKKHLHEIVQAYTDMETHDLYDMVLVMLPPRSGKSVLSLKYLSWIAGKYPLETQFATSYSQTICDNFYNGMMEIIANERFREVFPESPLVNQNAKRSEVWLQKMKRYPTLAFASIDASLTGRLEGTKVILCDDLVSGIQQALSPVQMESLWEKYTVNVLQRRKQGCKQIHCQTPWSTRDVITRLATDNQDDPRVKIIKIPALNENEESNFDFLGGFTSEYYLDLRSRMDSHSFNALFQQSPVDREGVLYNEDELQFYFDLPDEEPDYVIAVCDSKNAGRDYVASPVGYVYGENVYIEDVVYNNGLPEVTQPLVAEVWLKHKVKIGAVEANNGGSYFSSKVDSLIKEKGGRTSIRTFFSTNNKDVKIILNADVVKRHFHFKHKSKYSQNSPYANFMRDVYRWSQTAKKNETDDAVDSLAMLSEEWQRLISSSIKVVDRKTLRL